MTWSREGTKRFVEKHSGREGQRKRPKNMLEKIQSGELAKRKRPRFVSVSVSMRALFKEEISQYCVERDLEFSRWVVEAIQEKMGRELERKR